MSAGTGGRGGARTGARRQRPRPPERLWWEPGMRAALATHDLGTVFRILRERGYSQRLVGEWAGLSQPEVSAISNRRPVRHYAVLARIAAGLGIPPGLMGLAWCDGAAGAHQAPDHQAPDSRAPDQRAAGGTGGTGG